MKNLQKKLLLLIGVYVLLFSNIQAQDTTLSKKNIIKLNIASPAIATFALSYEVVLDDIKTFQTTIFYRNRAARDNDTSFDPIEEVRGWGITPELRFYLSNNKPAPLGFFVAPYATYQRYQTTEDIDNGNFIETKDVSSNVLGLGFTFGGQWTFKEVISIDVWGGPGYYLADTEVSDGGFIDGTNYRKGGSYSGRVGVNIGIAF